MKFLAVGLLSLCLLFAGCNSFNDLGQSESGIIPPASESTENGNSSNANQGSNENNQNGNPFAGGLENGGQFEGN